VIDPDVRRAEPADAPALIDLERRARADLRDIRGGGRWLDTHPELGDGWADTIGRRAVWVATIPTDEATDVVVGFLVADRAADPMPVARIDQVYVVGEARELGFGDALVAAAMAWARERDAELIEAETLPGDRNLKNLYERAGVTARLITVPKRL
jgi:GNAT superfamily N-acetyltransferase